MGFLQASPEGTEESRARYGSAGRGKAAEAKSLLERHKWPRFVRSKVTPEMSGGLCRPLQGLGWLPTSTRHFRAGRGTRRKASPFRDGTSCLLSIPNLKAMFFRQQPKLLCEIHSAVMVFLIHD